MGERKEPEAKATMALGGIDRPIGKDEEFLRGRGGGGRKRVREGFRIPDSVHPRKTKVNIGRGPGTKGGQGSGGTKEAEVVILPEDSIVNDLPEEGVAKRREEATEGSAAPTRGEVRGKKGRAEEGDRTKGGGGEIRDSWEVARGGGVARPQSKDRPPRLLEKVEHDTAAGDSEGAAEKFRVEEAHAVRERHSVELMIEVDIRRASDGVKGATKHPLIKAM